MKKKPTTKSKVKTKKSIAAKPTPKAKAKPTAKSRAKPAKPTPKANPGPKTKPSPITTPTTQPSTTPAPAPHPVKTVKLASSTMNKYRALLLDLRDHLIDGVNFLASDNLKRSSREVSGELSGYSLHMADTESPSSYSTPEQNG